MKKLSMYIFIVCLPLLMGASSCSLSGKYAMPVVEDCTLMSEYNATTLETKYTCFCINASMNQEKFDKLVLDTTKVFNGHHLLEDQLQYLEDNMEAILAKKEYEMDAFYCSYYSMTSATNRNILFNWAEENRLKRIKCERK